LGISEDGRFLISDGKTETAANIAEVSRLTGLVPVATAAHPTSALITKAEIAALVATRLRRYSQTMVWDIPVDETEHLSELSVMLISWDPARAMSSTGETTVDLEAELLLKTKDYSWRSLVLLLNREKLVCELGAGSREKESGE
jgi:hypothetical protein